MHVVRGSIAVFLLVYECTFCDWSAEVSSSAIGRFCLLEDYKKPSISVKVLSTASASQRCGMFVYIIGPSAPVHRRRRRRHDDAGIAVAVAKQQPRAHSACTYYFRKVLHKTVLTALYARQF